MKICIDAGHGMGNKTPGVFDPGAVGAKYREADMALGYAILLKAALDELRVPTFLTRVDNTRPCPVGQRAADATAAGCTALVSIHMNAYNGRATGCEVLYRDVKKDLPLARALQAELVRMTGLKDRGVIARKDLAVLKFAAGPAVLIELGFIDNPQDRSLLLMDNVRLAVVIALAKTLRDVLVRTSPKRFERIYTTEFGGGAEAGMPSAYGGLVKPNEEQASLPARVAAARRWIYVMNMINGHIVKCRVNDVGPWNTADAYWDGSGRPLAEKQYKEKLRAQNKRVPVNPAGLDLTPAAMDALGVPGKPNTRSAVLTWWFDELGGSDA